MRMYSKLPQSVKINGEKYKINTDFRLFIEFEERMETEEQVELGRVIFKALDKFYPAFFEILDKELLKEAIDKFLWFYSCGKKKIKTSQESKKNIGSRIFSYKYDSDLIWSAYHDKGYDLTVDKIHWWKFRAIWNSLPKDCEFCVVMGYRNYTGNDKDMLELKEAYKLPLSKFEISEKERHDKIFNQLKKFEKRGV